MNIFGKRLCRNSLRLPGVLLTVSTALTGIVAMSVSTAKQASGIDSAGDMPTSRAASIESARLPGADSLSDMFRSAAQQVLPPW